MPLYDIKKDFSKEVRWPYITIGVLFLIIMLFGTLFITSSVRSVRLRAANDRLTEQLDRATSTCTELAGTIANCQQLCGDIDELNTRSISTAREAIEIIEETRDYVMCLEVELGLIDTDSIYERLDSWLEAEQVDFIK